ncbi:hypothetical protein [Alteromonas facilis]|uniref:hypothetical protein n=1 Tax=Alteromonas facilis TaxID=2048004 RepID=UPI000C2866E4|nr:hypothetical protein [Alteromonas facilis]
MKYHLWLWILAAAAVIATVVYQFNHSEPQFDEPQILLEELFNASDVQAGLLEALTLNDDDLFESWQSRLIDAAISVGYKQQQLHFLEGDKGIDYLRFRASRWAFQREIDEAYSAGEAFEPIAAKYPQAKDLLPAVQALFEARDQTLDSIAEVLIEAQKNENDGARLNVQEANAQALALWQAKLNESATPAVQN